MGADPGRSDEQFSEWMRRNLAQAAEHFGVALTGGPISGWRLRSMGAPVRGPGGARWLRVVSEEPRWLPGDFWTGNADANAITDLSKPRVLDLTEWSDGTWRRVRAELMTLLPGQACSPTDVLRHQVTLSDGWWAELRKSIDVLRTIPTVRVNADQAKVTRRVQAAFGPLDVPIEEWETVHGDLQWSNLVAPRFGVLDWELWGRGPAGTDAATLLCHSLLVPSVARRVHEEFADVLDSDAGRVAQLHVAARLLTRAAQDYPDLADPLSRHVRPILDRKFPT